jgi:hypothetical protein
MKAVTGVFRSRSDAERAMARMGSRGVPESRVTLLTLETSQGNPGVSGERSVLAARIPGVGLVTAVGTLGRAVLETAGGKFESLGDEKLEKFPTEGWPEEEIFVYEDALRKGQSVLIVLHDKELEASQLRGLLTGEGGEATDAAREQWWIELRGAESEHYSAMGRDFGKDEKFYRLGFESALHARMRCKEYDQVLSEMAVKIEEVERENPGADVEEPFTKGYERGRDHYEQLCGEHKVA